MLSIYFVSECVNHNWQVSLSKKLVAVAAVSRLIAETFQTIMSLLHNAVASCLRSRHIAAHSLLLRWQETTAISVHVHYIRKQPVYLTWTTTVNNILGKLQQLQILHQAAEWLPTAYLCVLSSNQAMPELVLVGLDLQYNWQTRQSDSSFSSHLGFLQTTYTSAVAVWTLAIKNALLLSCYSMT